MAVQKARRDTLKLLLSAAVLSAAGVPLSSVRAQGATTPYPTRTVTLIVPFTPGTTADTLARAAKITAD
ncbi:MAG: hypothetical protein H0U63_02710 [Burkholderiales bacterium]|nr:hypothetical protein [Burkholderiales bacterium]